MTNSADQAEDERVHDADIRSARRSLVSNMLEALADIRAAEASLDLLADALADAEYEGTVARDISGLLFAAGRDLRAAAAIAREANR